MLGPAALRRTESEIDALDSRFDEERLTCCPSCAFGDAYTSLTDRAARQRFMLVVNLRKRGDMRDLRRARYLAGY